MTYRQQTLNAHIAGRLEIKLLSLQPSSAQLEETKLQVSGLLDLENTGSDLQGTVSNFDTRLLENWSVPIPEGLQAQSPQTTFALRGSLQNPSIEVDTEIDGRYQDRRFTLTIDAEGSRTSARFSQAHLASGDSEVRAKGLLDWTGDTTNLQVNMENLTQDLLQLAPETVTEAVPEELRFDASGALQVSGPLRKPQVNVQGLVTGDYAGAAETLPYRLTLDGGVDLLTIHCLQRLR